MGKDTRRVTGCGLRPECGGRGRFWDCGDNGAKNYANIFPSNEVDEIYLEK